MAFQVGATTWLHLAKGICVEILWELSIAHYVGKPGGETLRSSSVVAAPQLLSALCQVLLPSLPSTGVYPRSTPQ